MVREKKKTSIIWEARKRGNLRKGEMSKWVKYETEANKSQDQERFLNLGITRSPMTSKRMVLVEKLGRKHIVGH